MPPHPHYSGVAALAAFAIGAAGLLAFSGWLPPVQAIELGALLAAAIVASAFGVQRSIARDWATVPPSFIVDFAALVLLGTDAMTAVALTTTVAHGLADSRRSYPIKRTLANGATAVAATRAAGFIHVLLGGTVAQFEWPRQAIPIAAAVVAYCIIKGVAAEIIAPLITKRPVAPSWVASMLGGCSSHLIGAGVAVGLVELIDHRMWDVLPVTLVPLGFLYLAYCDHVGRLDEEHRRREIAESLVYFRTAAS